MKNEVFTLSVGNGQTEQNFKKNMRFLELTTTIIKQRETILFRGQYNMKQFSFFLRFFIVFAVEIYSLMGKQNVAPPYRKVNQKRKDAVEIQIHRIARKPNYF